MAKRLEARLASTPMVTCMKMLLMAFNVIFWITGIAILALGVWMKVQLYIYMELTTVYYEEAPYVLMGIGGGIVVIGSLGCCCTVKGKSFFLYLFAVFLVIVFVAELGVGIAGFVYRGKLEEGFKNGLIRALQVYDPTDDKQKTKTDAVDGVQTNLQCCGVDDYADWFATPWAKGKRVVPTTCCRETGCDTVIPPNIGNATQPIYTEGCYKKVSDFMSKNFGIMGGVAIGFAFLQLFGALLSCCLAKNINKAKYEQVA